MSPLEVWTTNEVVTDTNLNNMIDHAASTQLIYACPFKPEMVGLYALGTPDAPDLSVPAPPFVGRYLHVRFIGYNDGTNGDVKITLDGPGGEEDAMTITVNSGTAALFSDTVDCSTLTLNGDVRGADVTIKAWVGLHATIGGLQIWTGESSTDSDYGG